MLKMVLLAILSRYFFVLIASGGSMLVFWLRICTWDSGIWLRHWALRAVGMSEGQSAGCAEAGKVFVFLLLAGSAHGRRRYSHGVVWCLVDGYDAFVIDIYSCDRP